MKKRMIVLCLGFALVGCSSDTEQSPAAESIENTAVESQQEETLTSEEESSTEDMEESSTEEETQEESEAGSISEEESQEEAEETVGEIEAEESEIEEAEDTEDIFGLDGSRDYDAMLENEVYSDYTFSADEWLDEDGNLSLPFDENEEVEDNDYQIRKIRYYIPEEALKAASTSDLLSICTDTMFAKDVIAFDFLQYQVQSLASKCNALDEIFTRDDFAQTLLNAYESVDLVEDADESNDRACAIITMELFLARDEVFDMMTDEMREETLEAVMEKQEMILSGSYDYSLFDNSCFFTYIGEMVSGYEWLDFDGSEWYDYISENHSDYLKYCKTLH